MTVPGGKGGAAGISAPPYAIGCCCAPWTADGAEIPPFDDPIGMEGGTNLA